MKKEDQSADFPVDTYATVNENETHYIDHGDNSRLTSMVYPDGYTVNYNYASGVDDAISRLTSLSDSTGTLESYTYLGVNNVIGRSHPQPGLNLTDTLDQFGRIADHLWTAS